MSNTTIASKIQTMKQFADACHALSSNEIYELFENGISNELRDEIYQTFWSISTEPARAALRQLGERYSSIGLLKY
jgi:hypothetical protein